MKLRYQMRGLGIGIIVTALLMGLGKGEKIPLSDGEIKARASELGMVESDSLRLSDMPTASPEGVRDNAGESGAAGESGGASDGDGGDGVGGESGASGGDDGDGVGGESDASDGNGGDGVGGQSGGGDGASGEGTAPQDASGNESDTGDKTADSGSAAGSGQAHNAAEDGNLVTVVIEEGVTSYSVCQLLEELGLVEDADSLDFYICSNSYSRSILQGTYKIPRGTAPEEIVRIIMGNR